MSQMYGNVVQPEETNENVYEEFIQSTGSSGPTRQDDSCKKKSEKKNRKIICYNIVITTAFILTFGLAACGMFFVFQNKHRVQKLMVEMERKMITMEDRMRKIENETNLTRINHEKMEMKMVSIKDHMRDIDIDTYLIRINHGEFSSSVKDSIETMKQTLYHIESLEYPIAVRLFGGNSTQRSGRVEIRYNGIWGTICDDEWGQEESNVVCHMLGFGNASSYHDEAYFGRGNGKIWLDDVQCTGNESDITYCRHKGWGNHNCGHHEDISVACDSVPES